MFQDIHFEITAFPKKYFEGMILRLHNTLKNYKNIESIYLFLHGLRSWKVWYQILNLSLK